MLDNVLNSYRALGTDWYDNLIGPATTLYFSLVTAQAVFYFLSMGIAHRNRHTNRTARLASRSIWLIIFTGIGSVILTTSRTWIPAIFNGMVDVANAATSLGAVSPSSISTQGIAVTGQMFEAATAGGFMGWLQFLNSFTPWYVLLAAILTNMAFIGIAVQYMITEIAFYLCLGASPFFVAFLGIPRLAGIAEGFFRFLIYISVKIFLLYVLVHVAMEIPAAAMEMFPDKPEGWAQYYGLININGDWVWSGTPEDAMTPTGMSRAALTLVAASLSVLAAITAIPITFARMVSQNVNLGVADWWS